MKVIHIRLPDYIIDQLDAYIGKIASTRTGVIWTLLEHGLNYEWKKAIRKAREEKKQQPQESAQEVTADQQNITISPEDDKTIKKTLEIAKIRWVD